MYRVIACVDFAEIQFKIRSLKSCNRSISRGKRDKLGVINQLMIMHIVIVKQIKFFCFFVQFKPNFKWTHVWYIEIWTSFALVVDHVFETRVFLYCKMFVLTYCFNFCTENFCIAFFQKKVFHPWCLYAVEFLKQGFLCLCWHQSQYTLLGFVFNDLTVVFVGLLSFVLI